MKKKKFSEVSILEIPPDCFQEISNYFSSGVEILNVLRSCKYLFSVPLSKTPTNQLSKNGAAVYYISNAKNRLFATAEEFKRDLQRLPHLERLEVCGLKEFSGSFLQGLSNLKELKMGFTALRNDSGECYFPDGKVLEELKRENFFKHVPNLSILDLTGVGSYLVQDDTFASALSGLKNLRCLRVGISKEALPLKLASAVDGIEEFDLQYSQTDKSTKSLVHIKDFLSVLKNLKTLKMSISMRKTSSEDNNNNKNPLIMVDDLLPSNPLLRSLSLSLSASYGEDLQVHVGNIAVLCPNLERIKFRFASKTNNKDLLTNLTRLKSLELADYNQTFPCEIAKLVIEKRVPPSLRKANLCCSFHEIRNCESKAKWGMLSETARMHPTDKYYCCVRCKTCGSCGADAWEPMQCELCHRNYCSPCAQDEDEIVSCCFCSRTICQSCDFELEILQCECGNHCNQCSSCRSTGAKTGYGSCSSCGDCCEGCWGGGRYGLCMHCSHGMKGGYL